MYNSNTVFCKLSKKRCCISERNALRGYFAMIAVPPLSGMGEKAALTPLFNKITEQLSELAA